jgi:hypothetical protein
VETGAETGTAAGATVEPVAEEVWRGREPVAEAVRRGQEPAAEAVRWGREPAAETGAAVAAEPAAEAVCRG